MIVRNEAHCILTALESALPFIDYWVVLDNDSTDGTIELVHEYMAGTGIPGVTENFDQPFRYDTKWTRVMQMARGKCDYTMIMAADNTLEIVGTDDPFADLTADSYFFKKRQGIFEFPFSFLFKGDLDWSWTGVVHEFPHLPEYKEGTTGTLHNVIIHEGLHEGRNMRQHYYNHALLIERELLDHRHELPPFLVNRYGFYLANSWKDAGERGRAIECYQERVRMGGWEEEVYYSLLMIARLTGSTDDMLKAWDYRPKRLESAYDLMAYYDGEGMYSLALVIGTTTRSMYGAMGAPITGACTDVLFQEAELYGPEGKFEKLFEEVFAKRKFK
jgi:glycosyltransferase involved in cell wall biosynthesis